LSKKSNFSGGTLNLEVQHLQLVCAHTRRSFSRMTYWVGGLDEYLIPINVAQSGISDTGLATFTPSVPAPPAVWLFGSGLIALVGISRRKK